jgi:hypothetical protein
MVFLATTPEPEHISHRVMSLSAHSKAEGISRPVLASGVRSTADGGDLPARAGLRRHHEPDPWVNLPDASRFCREARVDWPWFFPTFAHLRDGGGSGDDETQTGTGRRRGELGWKSNLILTTVPLQHIVHYLVFANSRNLHMHNLCFLLISNFSMRTRETRKV